MKLKNYLGSNNTFTTVIKKLSVKTVIQFMVLINAIFRPQIVRR